MKTLNKWESKKFNYYFQIDYLLSISPLYFHLSLFHLFFSHAHSF